MVRLPTLSGQIHKSHGQSECVSIKECLPSKQLNLLHLRPSKVQFLKKCLTISLNLPSKELPLQKCSLPGQLLSLAWPIVGKLSVQSNPNSHSSGELPLTCKCELQRGLLTTEVRRPGHPNMGWQESLLHWPVQEWLHKVVQQCELKWHLVLQFRLKKNGELGKQLKSKLLPSHKTKSEERCCLPACQLELKRTNTLRGLSPSSILTI